MSTGDGVDERTDGGTDGAATARGDRPQEGPRDPGRRSRSRRGGRGRRGPRPDAPTGAPGDAPAPTGDPGNAPDAGAPPRSEEQLPAEHRAASARRSATERRRPAPTPDDAATAELRRSLRGRADLVALREVGRLRRRVDTAAGPEELAAVAEAVGLAELALVERAAVVPALVYPEDLPVSQRREEIAAAIRDHQVVVVAGETGSGKTTQLPKICLELGRGVRGMIGHTQPRRIAARSVAERIAEELGTEVGAPDSPVGYAVRFTDQVGPRSLVKLMTDGILLAEVQRDRMLRAYDTIIIDEAHERSLTIDFLLGYLAQLLPARPDLKVIITSATIDPQRFSRHFGGAPVVEVSGRTYPVEVRYRPLLEEPELDPDDPELELEEEDEAPAAPSRGRRAAEPVVPAVPQTEVRDQIEAIIDAVAELESEAPGDVLVFLSGEREIRDTAEALEGLDLPRTEVVPLYARLSAAEQHRVFTSRPRGIERRIVLATNVAETSLTVPGIRYVVDPGTARISRYSTRSKVQRLPIEAISQASANQRAGRCGRVADGICIRLYSEEDFSSRPEFTDPEVLRTSLAAVLLQMLSLGLGDIAAFPFIDPPDRRQIRDGIALLQELGALAGTDGHDVEVPEDADGTTGGATGRGTGGATGGATGGGRGGPPGRTLTDIGRRLAQLPVDPRLGRMVLEGEALGVLPEVLVVVAALSVQDPRERPVERQEAAAQSHRRFADESSDFVAWLNLWTHLRTQQGELGSSAFRRACRAEFLNFLRVREWQDLHGQLRGVLQRAGRTPGTGRLPEPRTGEELDAVRDAVHQALLAGLLSHLGSKDLANTRKPQEFIGARGTRFVVSPGSVLAKKPPAWVMAGELVETSRLWGRSVARVDPEWVERTAGHLLKRTYAEPHWERKRAAVVAVERATLYGLPVIVGRSVDYARIDPELSRELFVRHALVEGDWAHRHRALDENRELLAEVSTLEDRVRRRGLVVDDETLVALYEARLPAEVVSATTFDRWWKVERRTRPDALSFTREELLAGGADEDVEEQFPMTWSSGSTTLDLSYRFTPGEADDGVTVHVPVTALNQLTASGFERQVPGLREELVTALLRGLPKPVRVQLVPVPDTARAVVGHLDAAPHGSAQPFLDVVAEAVRVVAGVVVPRDAWSWDKVPDHLRATFVVTDDDGRELARGVDLDALREQVRPQLRAAVSRAVATSSGAGGASIERTGLTAWPQDLTELPERVEHVGADGGRVVGYPALVDEAAASSAPTARGAAARGGVGVGTAGVAVLESPHAQRRSHEAGVRRLLLLAVPSAAKAVVDRASNTDLLTMARAPHGSAAALVADVTAAAADQLAREHLAATSGGAVPRTAAAFEAMVAAVRPRVVETVTAAVPVVLRVVSAAAQVQRALDRPANLTLLASLTDARAQLEDLVRPGFVAEAGLARMPDVLRYLTALDRRLDALPADAPRDRDRTGVVQRVQDEHRAALARLAPARRQDPDVLAVRWMLQELRVSLFAQALGTPTPVSEKRIHKALVALREAPAG